ncbi:nucleotidyl transferase AbiEii/AbiGii toxin family protein [Rhodococcus sp. PSBB049]|uniref:nucleotidyl transferase AbiEii/AbiGii toxin family protein n=1 Tax=Rhodococcus sp. PSBB049 TaxID=2812863 RepID=UPI00198270BB|nr:nucleotidyl transferase AbiEii/AbiGii toxin family protein [Rhodococcus sp. PSBB049]QSE68576.1 nucleotidyl transferase AbiEii/AbiGii toxin family protein [Rhodococcus sp. PSBB049]
MAQKKRVPVQIRASIEAQLRQSARETDRPYDAVRRQFVYERFLDRVFSGDPHGWILKGGVGMMVRVPNARHSLDIDLVGCHDGDSVQALITLAQDETDPFRYTITPKRETDSIEGTRLTVVASLGGRKFEEFRIDLVNERSLIGEVERRSLMGMVDDKHGDFPRNADTVQLYPLADQIADKICAIHETHGAGHPSSRTRDLIDLLLIAEHLQPELAATVASVTAERDRRQITLPEAMTPPPLWASNWAKDTNVVRHLDPALRVFTHAVDAAGRCFDQVLSHVAAGTRPAAALWHPQHQHWAE